MRIGSIAVALACLSWSSAAAAEAEAQAKSVTSEDLVRDLGDERYPVRVRASHELWSLGIKAEEVLRSVADSADPEVAVRARELLRKIALGILPDSPPEVVTLVVRYDSASPAERVEIIQALKRLRAWRQVLKLHELEKDPDTLARIASEMEGVSVAAAREVLAGDEPDYEQARILLEMGRPEPGQLLSLAEFHRVKGTLEQELERARSLKGHPGHVWRYALQTAAGNYREAASEAEAAGDPRTAARLRLLMGDPLDWIRQAPIPSGQLAPDSIDAYRRTVEALWLGKEPSPKLVSALAGSIKHELDDESWHSLAVLYAIGESEVADPLFAKLSPSKAFFHFENSERIDKALETIGLDPANPDYVGWIREKFEAYIENPDEAADEAELLFAVAGFLERRGLRQVLLDGYVEPLGKLAREDPEVFIQTLGELFSAYAVTPVHTPVIPAASEFAGDDEARWSMVRNTLFGDGSHVGGVWDSFRQFRPGMTPLKRLELLGAVLGRVPSDGVQTAEWWNWIGELAQQGKKLDRASNYGLMLCVAWMNSDAERFLSTIRKVREAGYKLDELGVYSDEFSFGRYELPCLTAVGDWAEVAKHRRKEVEEEPNDPSLLAFLAATLRRAGNELEAEKFEEKAERLALGDVNAMRRMGQAYSSTGDFKAAAEWWMRAAAQSVQDDSEFYFCAASLSMEAQHAGDWKLAASLTEMSLLFQVMRGDSHDDPSPIIRGRMEAEVAKAIVHLDVSREESIRMLEKCRRRSITDGSLADYFLPALRKAGLVKLHDQWFEDSWKLYGKVIERFPGSHNTMNTAAWTASRANRRLDEAEKLVKRALTLMPHQAAYLDTYGEIWFAREDRDQAVKWSDLALAFDPGDDGLLRQNDRFRSAPFPID